MRQLYHYWFSPFCRKIRISLTEKALDFKLVLELPWKRRHEFLILNPAGSVPLLMEEDRPAIVGTNAITEYLEENHQSPNLLGGDNISRAEVRRLIEWFDVKFYDEVSNLIITEKVTKRFLKRGDTDASVIRYANQNINHHLQYIEYLTDRRNWLGGDDFSYADISAAGHISCVDYFGDVPWDKFPAARDWYARIKSRPSMQNILKDNIAGLKPADHYGDLDF